MKHEYETDMNPKSWLSSLSKWLFQRREEVVEVHTTKKKTTVIMDDTVKPPAIFNKIFKKKDNGTHNEK